ncbi:MAG: lipoate--protein ligase family protein [Alphaproteobacteria bacterium]|uniref:Lipoate--protein ligase family protein n=1 Tax=Candidatus Nitrobium versatile TaxID=2884831 RepID=A0A953JCZ9_9BACT|nr:lipoate--protein ligase family protein [Candidatus Nitrobium versatile]
MFVSWRLIDSGPCDAFYNMALDEAIALAVMDGHSPPTLRFYGWTLPSVSIGFFQKRADLDCAYCSSHSVPAVRRPTGGRGILHGDELTYSISSKNEEAFSRGLLDTYRQISRALQAGLGRTGLPVTMKEEREAGRVLTRSPLCFQSASYGEISFQSRKVIGSAQKRWREGFLQQGSIPYSIDYERLALVFSGMGQREKSGEAEKTERAMVGLRELLPDLDPERVKESLVLSFEEIFSVRLLPSRPSDREQELALRLSSEKYLPLC